MKDFETFYKELTSDEIWFEPVKMHHKPETLESIGRRVYMHGIADKDRFSITPMSEFRRHFYNIVCKTPGDKPKNRDWHVLGFTANEQERHSKFVITEIPNVIPVLITAGITKANCFSILRKAGIELPRVYAQGYHNANCIGCVKATSPTYWNHVRIIHPEVFNLRATQSRSIGCRLVRVKGKRMFLDELPENATGSSIESMNFECGIFCEITN